MSVIMSTSRTDRYAHSRIRLEYPYVYIIIMCVIQNAVAAPSEYGWVDTPPDVIRVLEGDNLTLSYRYRSPPGDNGPIRVELSHRSLANNYDTVLCMAAIDTRDNSVQINQEKSPGRVQIIPRDGGFSFHVLDIKLRERGRYWADAEFSTGAELYDSTDVEIFTRPSFKETSLSRQVFHKENETVSLEWSLVRDPSLPDIESVQIIHTIDGASFTVVDQRKLPNLDQWIITYPDEQPAFEDRVSYAPGPTLQHIRFCIWNLRVKDSGNYTINIVHANPTVKLEHTSTLVVSTGYRWIVSPNATTFVVSNQNNRLTFQTETKDKNISVQYELGKVGDHDNEILLGYIKVNPGFTEHKTDKCRDNWSMTFDKSSQRVLVTISNAMSDDGGRYIMKVVNDAQSVVLEQEFFVSVLNDVDLSPTIKITPSPEEEDRTTCIAIAVASHVPKPDIIIHQGGRVVSDDTPFLHGVSHSGETPALYTRVNKTSELKICVSRSLDEDVTYTVVLIYENTAAAYIIHRQIEIPRLRQPFIDATAINTSIIVDTDSGEDRDRNIFVSPVFPIVMGCTLAIALIAILVLSTLFVHSRSTRKPKIIYTKQPDTENSDSYNTDSLYRGQ